MRAVPDEDGFLDVGNLDKDLETIFPAEKLKQFSVTQFMFLDMKDIVLTDALIWQSAFWWFHQNNRRYSLGKET